MPGLFYSAPGLGEAYGRPHSRKGTGSWTGSSGWSAPSSSSSRSPDSSACA